MTDITYTSADLTALADELILNTTTHLRKEFDAGRIVGTDYANAYITSIQSSMTQAHQFLLQKDVAGLQADITYEQKLQAMNATEVSTGTKQNQIDMSDEQVVQQAVQGDIQDDQKLVSTDQVTQTSVQTRVVVAGELEQIAITANQKLLSDEQVIQSGVQGDIQDDQKVLSTDQVTQTSVQTRIVVAGELDQIAIAENQKTLSDEQVVQSDVHGSILDEQLSQAVKQTSLVTTQDDVATAIKQNQIDMSTEQVVQQGVQGNILDEQELVAVNQTYVSEGTKVNSVAMVQSQLDGSNEQLQVMRERHGMNGLPQFTQG